MSEITNLIESLKNGELGVVAQKLTTMQSEITNALTLIQNLTTEVQGDLLDPDNPVGVIHSPARPGIINESIEMFIGTYNVGDILAGAKKKTGKFIFGAGSECFFYFMPSNPLHAVNKKYVDQIVSPIANQLTNMIQRYGDRIPNSHPGIPNCMYIYSTDLSTGKQAKWLIDGLGADGLGASKETEFIGFNVNFSMFWLNVKDGRYFGDTIEDQHIANMGAVRSGFLSRTVPLATSWTDIETNPAYQPGMVKDAAVLFKNSKLRFDSTSRPEWNDARPWTGKGDDELATIKNAKDIGGSGGVASVCGPILRVPRAAFDTGTKLLSFAGAVIPDALFNTYFTVSGNDLVCVKNCVIGVMSSLEFLAQNVDGWTCEIHLQLLAGPTASTVYKDTMYLINTQDQNQGYYLNMTINANMYLKMVMGDKLHVQYVPTQNNSLSGFYGTCDICILQG
jgi:hypothetical protein